MYSEKKTTTKKAPTTTTIKSRGSVTYLGLLSTMFVPAL